MKIKIKVRLL